MPQPVDWPEGTLVTIVPLYSVQAKNETMKSWPEGYFDRLREMWGDEPFERLPQGDFELHDEL